MDWLVRGVSLGTWIVAAMIALPATGATLAILIFIWILAALDRATGRISFAMQAAMALALAIVKWLVIDVLVNRFIETVVGTWAGVYHPIFNPVAGAGALLVITSAGLYWSRRQALRRVDADGREYSPYLLGLICGILALAAITLTLEIDRMIERAVFANTPFAWPAGHLKQLAFTTLWLLTTMGMWCAARWTDRIEPPPRPREPILRHIPPLIAIKFLFIDMLLWRLWDGPTRATVLVNPQALAAAMLVAAMGWLWMRGRGDAPAAPGTRLAGALAVLTLLAAISLEIDRAFDPRSASWITLANPELAKQAALSIFWAIFAVGCVIAGFRIRAAVLRYFGLGLFALTLVKIVFVDLADIGAGARILSFIGVGGLLLGTSVVYGKLSPKFLGQPAAETGAS